MLRSGRRSSVRCRAFWRLAGFGLIVMALAACDGERRPAGPQDPGLSSQVVYEHPEGRFSVAVPRTWQGGYRIDAVSGAAAQARQPMAQHVVIFYYVPLAAATPEQALVTLSVFKPRDWASLEAGPPAPGTVVAHDTERVVVAMVPTRNPFDPASADARRFDAMRLTDQLVRSAVTLR
jgi:hypothetical protein